MVLEVVLLNYETTLSAFVGHFKQSEKVTQSFCSKSNHLCDIAFIMGIFIKSSLPPSSQLPYLIEKNKRC